MPYDRDAAYRELTPTGKLRVGVIVAPTPSVLFATRDGENAMPKGVTVDFAHALASALGASLEIITFLNSGACTDALDAGRIDISLMPVDDERRRRVAFTRPDVTRHFGFVQQTRDVLGLVESMIGGEDQIIAVLGGTFGQFIADARRGARDDGKAFSSFDRHVHSPMV